MTEHHRGIENPGSLCFMIAAVQQLFWMPSFCNILINLTLSEEEMKNKPVLFELVHLFKELKMPESATAVNILPLFDAMYGNKADVDIFEQQDVSDFLAALFQHLHANLKDTVHNNFLASTVAGGLQNLLFVPGDAVKYLASSERFYVLSVGVTAGDLNNSLVSFTSEQSVNYRWPVSGHLACPDVTPPPAAVPEPTVKTTRFQSLPQHLLLHLKRFRFDARRMRKEKLVSRFDFPQLLDMSPYLSEAPAEPAQAVGEGDPAATATSDCTQTSSPATNMYRLSGCVVHRGASAYRGHYYCW